MQRATGIFVLLALLVGGAGGATAKAGITLYQTGNNGQSLFTTNSANGASTFIGNFGYSGTYSLAFSPNNTLYAVVDSYNSSELATVNPLTGAATPVGVATHIPELMAIVFSPNGTLYAASWGTNDLYTLNPSTGAATLVGSLGFNGIMDLAFDSSGNLYGISTALYEINTSTGAGTLVTNLANTDLMGLTITPSGQFLATDYYDTESLYQINTANGSLTDLGSTGIAGAMALTYEGVAGSPSPAVPEPSSIVLFGMALTGLGAARWRKRKQAA